MSNDTLQSLCSWGGFFSLVAAAAFTVGYNHYSKKIEKEKEAKATLEGQLEHKSESFFQSPGIHVDEFPDISDDKFVLKFGNSSFGSSKSQLQGGVDASKLFNIGNTEPIIIKVVDNKLSLTTKIIGNDGKIICELDDNSWSVNPNNYYKRNYDATAVEVIDEYDNVVLSVELLNPNLIQMYGIVNVPGQMIWFGTIDDFTMMPSSNEFKSNWKDRNGKTWEETYSELAKKIPRKFSYKGKDSFGKRL